MAEQTATQYLAETYHITVAQMAKLMHYPESTIVAWYNNRRQRTQFNQWANAAAAEQRRTEKNQKAELIDAYSEKEVCSKCGGTGMIYKGYRDGAIGCYQISCECNSKLSALSK